MRSLFCSGGAAHIEKGLVVGVRDRISPTCHAEDLCKGKSRTQRGSTAMSPEAGDGAEAYPSAKTGPGDRKAGASTAGN